MGTFFIITETSQMSKNAIMTKRTARDIILSRAVRFCTGSPLFNLLTNISGHMFKGYVKCNG